MNVIQEGITRQASSLRASSKPSPLALKKFLAVGVGRFFINEIKNEGVSSFLKTIGGSIKKKELIFSSERTLGEELETRADRLASKIFLSFEGEKISYAQLNESAANVAQFMIDSGMQEGSSAGVFMPNIPAFLEVFFATQRVGACTVPINTSLKDEGLAHIFNNAGITKCLAEKTISSP